MSSLSFFCFGWCMMGIILTRGEKKAHWPTDCLKLWLWMFCCFFTIYTTSFVFKLFSNYIIASNCGLSTEPMKNWCSTLAISILSCFVYCVVLLTFVVDIVLLFDAFRDSRRDKSSMNSDRSTRVGMSSFHEGSSWRFSFSWKRWTGNIFSSFQMKFSWEISKNKIYDLIAIKNFFNELKISHCAIFQ